MPDRPRITPRPRPLAQNTRRVAYAREARGIKLAGFIGKGAGRRPLTDGEQPHDVIGADLATEDWMLLEQLLVPDRPVWLWIRKSWWCSARAHFGTAAAGFGGAPICGAGGPTRRGPKEYRENEFEPTR